MAERVVRERRLIGVHTALTDPNEAVGTFLERYEDGGAAVVTIRMDAAALYEHMAVHGRVRTEA